MRLIRLILTSVILCPSLLAISPTSAFAESRDASCAELGFDQFLRRFGHEIAFQEKSVADPLEVNFVDPTAEPEPKTITNHVPLAEVEWPVVAELTMLKRSGHEIEISDEPGDIKKVLIRKPDTGDQQSYYFARRPCWQLVKMFDESL